MEIRPVVTVEDHKAALAEIDRLWGAAPGTRDGDRLDVLVALVEHYESSRYPVPDADPVEILAIHMEMTGRNQGDLAALLGSPSRASEILRRKRPLTMEMVRRLHRDWGIPADALIAPYELARAG